MLTKNMDVFLHIPKCGGSTIRQYYARAYKHEILYIGRDHPHPSALETIAIFRAFLQL